MKRTFHPFDVQNFVCALVSETWDEMFSQEEIDNISQYIC